ncbi:MAG: 3'-5' exonuclease [Clostridia bacterium]|nr:3'-5' exonuclease [Clostridia bacterium]
MKYLFFDIECAGVSKNKARICAFGYCLTDEKFNILEKEDILINPQSRFHLTDRRGEQGIVLPYSYGEFKNYPTFPEIFPKIKALIEDKDTLVAGHATMNDVKYLNLESGRFSLPSFTFNFTDTQFIYMNKISEFSRQFGLQAIADELNVEFTPHRAVDDAYATMRIAEAMCKELQTDFVGLLKSYEITMGRIENYEITQSTSVAYKAHLEQVTKRKEARERCRVEFHAFYDKEKRKRAKDGKLKNKRVCFSHGLVYDVEQAKTLLKGTFDQAAFYSFRAEECDVYVYTDGEIGPRIQSAQANKARLVSVEEFKKLVLEDSANNGQTNEAGTR